LTVHRINRLEDAGQDYASVPGFDALARELADRYPALGMGQGYAEDDVDRADHAGWLWEQLRTRDERTPPKHDSRILRRAAELVASQPANRRDRFRPMSFSNRLFTRYLLEQGIAWPRREDGQLALDQETFREMAKIYPRQIGPIRELRDNLSQLKLNELQVGSDGRNRCLLSPFASRTGRNQPSNSRFVFGPATWLRSLIKPEPGRAVAYIDWSQQELGIAAALSGDERMQQAYTSGDFYLEFGKLAGAVPSDGTKRSHAREREQFKAVCLGVLFGLGPFGLARKLDLAPCWGRELLQLHQRTFRKFWAWSDALEAQGMLGNRLHTAFGWNRFVGPDANPRSLRNFPMQANGAEMMRLACCLATERGIGVCCPVHDALLVEAGEAEIDHFVARTQAIMEEASELVLPGFPLRTEAKVVRYPDRYTDGRGERMWEGVCLLLDEVALEGGMQTC
jgi:hypothetical protein